MDMVIDHPLSLFSQYEEGPLGFDKRLGRSRGFALFIFRSVDATKRALEEPMKTIDGHQMFCKLVIEVQKSKLGSVNALAGSNGSDINGLNQCGNVVSLNSGMQFGGMGKCCS